MRHNPPGVTPHTLCALGGCARHHKLWILRYLGKPAQRVSSEGRKEGKMKCWKNHSFKRHFFFPCCRWSYRNQSLPFRPRTGKEPVNQRAKLSSGTAQQSVLLLTNKVGAEHNTVTSYHQCESGLSVLHLQLFATGSSKPTDKRFTAANCLPLQLLFVQFPGQELGSNCGSGLQIFSVSLVEKLLKCRIHRCSRAFR